MASEIKHWIAQTILKPLIAENYRRRAAGLEPDEWFWADKLACDWGCWEIYGPWPYTSLVFKKEA